MTFSTGFVKGKTCKECKGTTFHNAGCAIFHNELWEGNVTGIMLRNLLREETEKIIKDIQKVVFEYTLDMPIVDKLDLIAKEILKLNDFEYLPESNKSRRSKHRPLK